ncbi:MAG TPA: MoaD/ThiS family protein [Pirellulaceae bacterium]|nr:MoaD/ThiS family protein [Pirellulaceae bacterium]
MPTIFVPPQLRELTCGQAEVQAQGATVREIVAALEKRFPGLEARLCRAGELSPALQVSIDGVLHRSGLQARVQPSSEVHFLPVFGGG